MNNNYCEYNSDVYYEDGTCLNMVSNTTCTDENACNFNNESCCVYSESGYDCEGNITGYVVGMEAEGGIVFYVDSTGQHGLVAALEDLPGTYQWGCYQTDLSGADGQAIGTGYQNTLDIVSGCSETPIAASGALDYESEDHSDWYLPSKDELLEMYNTIGNGGPDGNIGSFVVEEVCAYWSSSEDGSWDALAVSFIDGMPYCNSINLKVNSYRVRVIRAF